MGIYSTNRVNSIMEAQNDVVTESFESPELFSGNLLEVCCQIHENDLRMFNSVLESDFITSSARFVMEEEEAKEAEKAGETQKALSIGDKIKGLFAAVKNAIVGAISKFITKIQELVSSDQKLYDTYKDVLTVENLKKAGFVGVENYAFPKKQFSLADIENLGFKDQIDDVEDAMKKLADPNTSKEEINGLVEEINNKTDEKAEVDYINRNKYAFLSRAFLDKQANFVPNDAQLKEALDSVKEAKDLIAKIKQLGNESLKKLKKYENDAVIAVSKINKSTDADSAFRMNVLYKLASLGTRIQANENAYAMKLVKQQLAAYRKLVIVCGKAAAAGAKGQKVEKAPEEKAANEAYNYILGEASDMYVYEALEM